MKALAKLERAPGLTLTRVKKPEVGHNDVLIRRRKTAICGTDMHIWNWDEWAQKTIPVPMHVGHEYVGEIVEIGQEVRGFKIGDRVSGEGHITCGFCRNCRAGRRHLCRNTVGVGVNRPGAFAQYLAIPAGNAFKLPDSITDDIAAILDPFGNATHTALAFSVVGEDVLITGAGPIGIMATAVARFTGARHASRRLDRHSRHPARGHRHRLESGDLQGPDPQGHLRPRDVRDLVQNGEPAAERTEARARNHPSLRGAGISQGLRDHGVGEVRQGDRKSTRLNSSHGYISYAVFCLKKKKKKKIE